MALGKSRYAKATNPAAKHRSNTKNGSSRKLARRSSYGPRIPQPGWDRSKVRA